MQLPSKIIQEIQSCQTAEELIAKAKNYDIDLEPELAEILVSRDCFEEIDPDNLNEVAGGGCSSAVGLKDASGAAKKKREEIYTRIMTTPLL